MRCSPPPQSCGASIMLHLAVSAQFSTHLPSSIMVIILDLARNYPRDTFRIFHVYFQDFKHQIYQGAPCKRPVRRSPSSCSIHLEPRKSSCWHSKLRCWYIPILILRSKYDTPPTPWHKPMASNFNSDKIAKWAYSKTV